MAGRRNKNDPFGDSIARTVSKRSYRNEMKVIDIEDDAYRKEGNQDSGVANLMGNPIISGGKYLPDGSTTLCFMKKQHKVLYKVLWMIVNILLATVSCYYIITSFKTWQSSPVVQALSNRQVHFQNISFPAVTICWPCSFKKDYDFFGRISSCLDCENHVCTVKNETCGYTELTTLVFAYDMCYKYAQANPLPQEVQDYMHEVIDGDEFKKYMEKLLPPCESDSVTTSLAYIGKPLLKYTRCDSFIFQQFYSSQNNGACMTYNSLSHQDIYTENVVTTIPKSYHASATPSGDNEVWSFDNMMDFKGGLNSVPIYGQNSIHFFINNREKHFDNVCQLFDNNLALITVHSPNEIPLDYDIHNGYYIRENVMFEILVVPRIILAREDLAYYPPQQRGCYFTHEKKLAMFKYYTKSNCDLECLVNSYLQHCGCVPFEYPRQNDTVKVCRFFCPRPKFQCGCLPDCNFLSYKTTVQEVPSTGSVLKNITMQAVIKISLKGNTFYTNIRYSITSFADFLAYSLGVLGAFLGFSVTCVWELVYFGLIRFCHSVTTACHKTIYPHTTIMD